MHFSVTELAVALLTQLRHFGASDSFSTIALYKSIYLLTFLPATMVFSTRNNFCSSRLQMLMQSVCAFTAEIL